MINKWVVYKGSIKSQFKKLGDSHEITWNDEFSVLDLYFDSNWIYELDVIVDAGDTINIEKYEP